MTDESRTDNPELDVLFERYRAAPNSYVFAPLADACRKAGMVEAAIEICEKGVSAHPDYPSGFVVRGKCYMDIGNTDQAEASFEKVLELDPNNLVALRYTGIILAERGEGGAARKRFEHILALDPANREIREHLGAIEERDERAESEDAPTPTLSASPARPTRTREHAVDARAGDEEKDEDEFTPDEISLGDDEPTPDALATMTLADIYAAQGHTARAVKIYREILQQEPDNQLVRKRLAGLGESVAQEASAPATETPPPAAPPAPPESPPPSAFARMVEDDNEEVIPPPSSDEALFGSREATPGARNAPETKPRGDDRNVDQFRRWIRNLTR